MCAAVRLGSQVMITRPSIDEYGLCGYQMDTGYLSSYSSESFTEGEIPAASGNWEGIPEYHQCEGSEAREGRERQIYDSGGECIYHAEYTDLWRSIYCPGMSLPTFAVPMSQSTDWTGSPYGSTHNCPLPQSLCVSSNSTTSYAFGGAVSNPTSPGRFPSPSPFERSSSRGDSTAAQYVCSSCSREFQRACDLR